MNQKNPQTNSLQVSEINYSGKSAKIVQNSNYDTSPSPGFLDEGTIESLQP